jgi:hypothetical protein
MTQTDEEMSSFSRILGEGVVTAAAGTVDIGENSACGAGDCQTG